MTLSTYAELKASIAQTVVRSDLTDDMLSGFVRMAEASIARVLRHRLMETRATASLDSRFYALPADWVETIRLHLPDGGRMELCSHAALQDYRTRNLTAGKPSQFAHIGGEIEIYPVPDAAYEAELIYYAAIPALSDLAPTNWLLATAPDAYLYGALIHTAPLLQEDQRIATWSALYDAAINGLNAASDAAKWSGTGLRKRFT